MRAEVIGAAIGRIVIGVKAIAGEDDAVIALIGKAATAHGVGALGIERASVEDFCVQADACDAIAIEDHNRRLISRVIARIVFAPDLRGIELSSEVEGSSEVELPVVEIELKAGEHLVDASQPRIFAIPALSNTGRRAMEMP